MAAPGAASLAAGTPIYFHDGRSPLALAERSSIARETRETIGRLCRLEPRRNLRLAGLGLVLALVGWLVASEPPLVLRLACQLVMGMALVGLSVMMHEAAHSLLFRNRGLNRWLGVVCGGSLFVSFTAYRSMHLAHHRHTGTQDDPDDPERASRLFPIPLAAFYCLYALVGSYPYLVHIWVAGFRLAGRNNRLRIAGEAGLIAAALGAAGWLMGPWQLAQVWLLPWLVAAQISSLRGVAEHGLTTGGNPFTGARTVVSGPLVRLLLCNVNYHLEHHLFTGVPWYNLPELHRLLSGEYGRLGACVHSSYTSFYRDFLRCVRAGVRPGVRLVPREALNAADRRGSGAASEAT